jgi:hypothetical protein
MSDQDFTTLKLFVHGKTALAVCVSQAMGERIWLPKSQVLLGPQVAAGEPRLVRLPVWLARSKGLIGRKQGRRA